MRAAQLLQKRLPGQPAARLHEGAVIVDRMRAEISADGGNSRCRRSVGGHGSASARKAAPARRDYRRDRRCRSRRGRSAPAPPRGYFRYFAKTLARCGSIASKAPACTRHSSALRLTICGSMRAAKSARSSKGLAPRAATSAPPPARRPPSAPRARRRSGRRAPRNARPSG